MPPPTGTKPDPLPGWMRCDYRYLFGTEPCGQNTLWLSYDPTEAEAAEDTDLDAVEAHARNDWLTYVAPHVSNDLVLREIRLVLFRASGELAVPYTTSASGSQAGGNFTNQVAACVNWDVHAFYRGGKPKIFLPGACADWQGDERLLDATYSSSLETSMNALILHVPTWTTTHLTSAPVLIAPSWSSHGAYRGTAVQRQVHRAWVQPRFSSQRRRLGRPIG